ncbi:MAG: ArnT family glycosyltransferase [Maricaulaceae bacterium]
MSAKLYQNWTLALILGLLVFRVAALLMFPLGLHGDEAQYWAWSKNLDWGYFTKPPLIAWVIASTTSVFGDAEWAVRISSPFLHSITGFVIFLTGRVLFNAQTGFWAACIYLFMPALWLSSLIVSTDVSLLLCWAVALHAAVLMRRDGPSWPRGLQLGLAIGIGMLAKYAMLFFVLALLAGMIFDAPSRRAFLSRYGLAAGVIAAVLITPNVMWNARHDFATLSHTAANANLGGSDASLPVHPIELISFLIDQFGVFGPISFAVLLCGFWMAIMRKLSPGALWISIFSAMSLCVICAEALLSRANANWAVTSYVAGSILAAHIGISIWPRAKRALKFGVVFQNAIGLLAISAVMSPSLTNTVGLANSVKRLRAWPETKTTLEGIYKAGHEGQKYEAIAFDKRIIFYDLLYYGLDGVAPMRMWLYRSHPENHAELTKPLAATSSEDAPILIVNYYDIYEEQLREDFARLEALPPLDIDLGGGKRRQLNVWAGYGYTPTKTR